MIRVTENAVQQIQNQSQQDGMQGLGLRIAAKPDQKGNIDYAMGFDDIKDDDNRIQCDGFEVVISPESEELLQGATLDYVEIESGDFEFIFLNPNDPNYKPPQSD